MRSPVRTFAFLAAAAIAVLGSVSASARAGVAIQSFSTTTSTSAAGSHPDLVTGFALANPAAPEVARNVTFNAPAGVFGNVGAVTKCTASDFALSQCPSASQVGLITIRALSGGDPNALLGTAPIFDLEPRTDETARFAFIAPQLDIPISIPVSVRTGSDYGLRFKVQDISQQTPLAAAELTFWGFPADPSHNLERFPKGTPGNPANCEGLEDTSCIAEPTLPTVPNRPLTDNPTTCSGLPLVTTLDVQSYQDPANVTHAESSYPPIVDCGAGTFNPLLRISATTDQTDSPSGLNLTLGADQFQGFAVSPSQLRSARVTLPPGFTVNPDAADGQTACSDAAANLGSEGPANCPDSAKIGTFDIGSTSLEGPLEGSVYFAEPKPGDQYRLFLIASGYGLNAKLIGSFRPDPASGQITAFFDDLPQVPFESFNLHLFASDRGLMATPTRCTQYAVSAELVPWNGALASQVSEGFFGLNRGPHGAGCPGVTLPFSPRLVAGTSNPVAGAHSDFTLKLDREDGDQYLGDLNFTMPPGLIATLKGTTYCSDAAIEAAKTTLGRAEIARPSCPASSYIGTSNVAAGPGAHPFHASGKVYFSGPFKGAPLSLVTITPALAGPYDYGNVVVRVALFVDEHDAHVTALSDTVPQIIGGIPLRLRTIQVNLDRPNFILNPTNCSPFAVASQGVGDQGTVANFTSPFAVVNCAPLPFAPRMVVRQVGGRAKSQRRADPALQFDLLTRPGEANVKSVAVTLSKAFLIDTRHLGNLCTEAELIRTRCAGRQAIGVASVTTPVLDAPLSGLVYAVSGGGNLPRLAFLLGGQVTIVPRAVSRSTSTGALRTVVPLVPDAPIGHFRLRLFGGKRGYLVNSRSLCAQPAITKIDFTGQNGAQLTRRVKTNAACGKKPRKTKKGS